MADFTDSNYQVPFILDAKFVLTPKSFAVVTPATSTPLWDSSTAAVSDAHKAVESCARAFPAWSKTKQIERRDLFYKLATVLEEQSDDLVRSMKSETGAAEGWARFNVKTGIEFVREVAARVTAISGILPESLEEGRLAIIKKEPYGVVLGIAPWNAPLILSLRAILFPLAAGNTVILKSSELSPRTHHLIAHSFILAGFPAGTVNTLIHSRDTAQEITTALISHPSIKKINFTGSTAVGRIIAETAGRYLKPVVLELGGKAGVIVLPDADIEKAAGGIAWGGFFNAGQICMASERILVHKSIFTPFLESLRKSVHAQFGRLSLLSTTAAAKKTHALVSAAIAQGATIANKEELGFGEEEYLNFYHKGEFGAAEHPNIILAGVTDLMAIYGVESFGPVVVVMPVEDEEEAIRRCNDGEYGLSAGIWTGDMAAGLRVANQIESGAVHVNGPTVHDEPQLPHGGRKASGYGRFGAHWGIDEFLATKTVTMRF
ncbi:hypothetical protein RUND412_010746 [Rhizina undulata]